METFCLEQQCYSEAFWSQLVLNSKSLNKLFHVASCPLYCSIMKLFSLIDRGNRAWRRRVNKILDKEIKRGWISADIYLLPLPPAGTPASPTGIKDVVTRQEKALSSSFTPFSQEAYSESGVGNSISATRQWGTTQGGRGYKRWLMRRRRRRRENRTMVLHQDKRVEGKKERLERHLERERGGVSRRLWEAYYSQAPSSAQLVLNHQWQSMNLK